MEKTDFISTVTIQGKKYNIFNINKLEEKGIAAVAKLPFSIKILVENLLRKMDGRVVRQEDLLNIARWKKRYEIGRAHV